MYVTNTQATHHCGMHNTEAHVFEPSTHRLDPLVIPSGRQNVLAGQGDPTCEMARILRVMQNLVGSCSVGSAGVQISRARSGRV